jgi:hypothetical protein
MVVPMIFADYTGISRLLSGLDWLMRLNSGASTISILQLPMLSVQYFLNIYRKFRSCPANVVSETADS